MTTNNYKHAIMNEIREIRQLLFSHVSFFITIIHWNVPLIFAGIVFVTFADTLSVTFKISSRIIAKSPIILSR